MKPNTVHPEDEQWVREQEGMEFDTDGVCFVVWRGEVLGPFACSADANEALDKRMAEVGFQMGPGVDCGRIIFADPAVYHVNSEAKLNG
jgi:hypothetical protein